MPGGNKRITGADGKPFTKGDPRINKEGRPKKLPELDQLLAETLGAERCNKTAMEWIIIKLTRKAEKGDIRAAELLMDRGYGKLITKQSIEMNLDGLTEDEIILIQNHRIERDEKGQN